ncbi:RNA polymerase sigma factor [Chitinophaga terrae (ex Kim and Jung 2007)]|uniref:RNA polymerase sigma factor n=1 Tax=Chitinophaga terrae (ex Kim and Jung 2007) TaxID=408074 RepID=UPI000B7D1EF8|nr:sigma-70 family RNA polymerase sigma factor [Chitinophaga terrae (ex Kim and Jung 2007)]MDQ0107296.1 RNA polymerase sigma-70 factor (ECF subfamily) [Chitinophaga terrae (ex Kim and Jung 2007)]GEP88570.1 DNA-directed RNA polymerase sigma-70 factor [Chitinophaga terrae (ex Kim and Jung 2007)]
MNNPAIQQLTDQELLQRFKADHNSEWIGVLFDRYAVLLLGMCMKYLKNEEDARDAVQQIFLKVLSDVNNHEIQFFKAWIYQVTKNYCLMQLRSHPLKYKEEISDRTMGEMVAEPLDKKAYQEKDLLIENMEHAIQQLNPEQRTCIQLFYLDKKSYQEIADKTGYSLLQVKSYIQNGKRNLKLLLEKQQRTNH